MNRQTIGRLLPLFVRDLQAGCLTTKSMSANLTEIIGGTDADGAWTWRQAYDLMQAAAIIADRSQRSASDQADRLAMLAAMPRRGRPRPGAPKPKFGFSSFRPPCPTPMSPQSRPPSDRAMSRWSHRPEPEPWHIWLNALAQRSF